MNIRGMRHNVCGFSVAVWGHGIQWLSHMRHVWNIYWMDSSQIRGDVAFLGI